MIWLVSHCACCVAMHRLHHVECRASALAGVSSLACSQSCKTLLSCARATRTLMVGVGMMLLASRWLYKNSTAGRSSTTCAAFSGLVAMVSKYSSTISMVVWSMMAPKGVGAPVRHGLEQVGREG